MLYVGFAFTDRALDFLDGLPPKIRRQVIKKAKALHTSPHSPTSKKLHNVETPDGDPVHRERSGDYRILYVVRSEPNEVLILDIDNRKDVYRMPKTDPKPSDEMRMKEADFDDMMRGALNAPPPQKESPEDKAKRLSAHPPKRQKR